MRKNLAIFSFWITLLLFTACQSDSPKNQENPSSKPKVETETTATTPEKPVVSKEKKIDGTLTVYSDQNTAIEQEVFKEFEESTGIKVNLVHDSSEALIERLKKEGKNSPADLLLVNGLRNLNGAKSAGLLRKLVSAKAESQIPEEYRDEERHWFGLTRDAVLAAYLKEKLDPAKMGYYEYFSRLEWKGKLLLPSSKHHHIQSLVASILAWDDLGKANSFLSGMIANLAVPIFETEAETLAALEKEAGELALVSSSSLAKFLGKANKQTKDKIAVFYPKNMGGATYFDILGIGVCQHSPNAAIAGRLIEFLGKKDIQERYAKAKFAYPSNTTVLPDELLQSWGTYHGDDLAFSKLYQYEKQAEQILKTVAWK